MHQFDEHHAEFKGFSEHFEDHVRPGLVAQDGVRYDAVKDGAISGAVLAIFIVVGFLIIAYVFSEAHLIFFGAFVAIPAAVAVFLYKTRIIRSETKTHIVSAITDYIDWQFREEVKVFDLAPYRENFLLTKSYDRSSFEDRLSGEAHSASFESVEAHLEKRMRDSKGRTRWVTVFRGQLMRLDFPTKTFGRTVVLRDAGIFNKKKRGDMKRVGLSSPKFEKTFEAYGTDQVEARVILDPVFMQRMIDLEASVEGKRIRFAFVDNDLFIAVETGNRYEAGSMLQPLDAPERMQRILDEVGVIYDIVDGLVDRPAGRR